LSPEREKLSSRISRSAFCTYGAAVEAMSLRQNEIKHIDNDSWKCLPQLKQLAIGKNSPEIDKREVGSIHLFTLPPDIETIDASYFQDVISLGQSVLCYSTSSKKRFSDWMAHVPTLPKPDSYPVAVQHAADTYRNY
jgi:hypothetical protein